MQEVFAFFFDLQKNKKYLEMHKRMIWQGKDGDYYTKVVDDNGKVKIRHAVTRESLEKLIIKHYKGIEERPTVRRVFEKWMQDRIRYEEVELGTIDKAKVDFNRFIAPFSLASMHIGDVNADVLTPFIKASIHENNLTAKAWAGLKGILFGIFAFAKEQKFTDFSISSYFGDLRLPKAIFRKTVTLDEEQVFSDEEIKRIVHWITADEERLSSLVYSNGSCIE